MNLFLTRRLPLLSVLLLSGCAVGIDFQPPEAPRPAGFIGQKLEHQTAGTDAPQGAAQIFNEDKDIPARWWEMFHSPALNALVEQGLAANPDLQAAQATLKQTQELVKAGYGDFFPALDAKFAPTRQKISGASFGQPNFPGSIYTLYNASVGVSYTLDVFGGVRRQVEALQAHSDAQKFQTEATYLTLTSNIVTAAIQEASIRAQIKETQDILDVEGRQLKILSSQFELGGIAKVPVLAQQATLAQAQVNLPILQKQLAQVQHQLAALCGKPPSEQPEDTLELDSLTLPQELPLTLPSKLVEQRPDIRAAQEQLHVASAQVGVATAAMLPNITIGGDFGYQAVSASNLFRSSTEVWSIAGNILQPIFHGGTLLHQKRAATAAYEAAQARYRSVVLQSFQNVADVLQALNYDAQTLSAQNDAATAAASSLNLQQSQYTNGAVTYISLLDAQRTYQQARIGLVQAQAQRLNDTVALFQSLGGGWWNRDMKTVKVVPLPQAAPADSPAEAALPPARKDKRPWWKRLLTGRQTDAQPASSNTLPKEQTHD